MAMRVVHIDADEARRERFRRALANTSFELVKQAADAGSAIAAVTDVWPDILVISLSIPSALVAVGGALDVISAVLAGPEDPAVIITCSDETRNLYLEARERGATAWIDENASQKQLLEVLRKVGDSAPGIDPARRERARFDARLISWYKKQRGSVFRKVRPGTIQDISGGGVKMSTVEEMPVGTKLILRLKLPTADHPIKVHAAVAWSSPDATRKSYDVGLQFTGMSDASRSSIEVYIARRLAE